MLVVRTQIRMTAFRCHVTMSTSCSGGCVSEQLPSGLRAASPRAAHHAGKDAARMGELAGAAGDFREFAVTVRVDRQLSRVEGERAPTVVLRGAWCPAEDQIVPADVGRVAGLAGDLDDPADAGEHPFGDAITVVMTVRVPDTPEVTMVPLSVSCPLVAAAAGKAVAVEMASAIPAASNAPVTCRFMLPPPVRSLSPRNLSFIRGFHSPSRLWTAVATGIDPTSLGWRPGGALMEIMWRPPSVIQAGWVSRGRHPSSLLDQIGFPDHLIR